MVQIKYKMQTELDAVMVVLHGNHVSSGYMPIFTALHGAHDIFRMDFKIIFSFSQKITTYRTVLRNFCEESFINLIK